MTEPCGIVFTRRARKDLDDLDQRTIKRIAAVIDALVNNPRRMH